MEVIVAFVFQRNGHSFYSLTLSKTELLNLSIPSPILTNPYPPQKLLLLSFMFAFLLSVTCACYSVCALILWGNSCSPRFSIFLTTPPLSNINKAARRCTEANPSYYTKQRILCYLEKDISLNILKKTIDVLFSPGRMAAFCNANENASYMEYWLR